MGVLSEYLARKDRDSNAAAVRGLMSVYNTGNQGHSVTPQQQGLMDNGQLPPQFYQRAGTVPGYESLLGQAQTGQQAMNRQTQEQGWSAENMTAAQAEQVRQRQEQMAQQQAQWAGVSGNQQAVIDAQQGRWQAEQAAAANQPAAAPKPAFTENAEWMVDPNDPTGQRAIARPGGKVDQQQQTELADIDLLLETIDEAQAFQREKGSYESGEDSLNLSERLASATVRGKQILTNAQTLGEEEAARLASDAWDFNSKFNMFTNDDTAKAKLESLRAIVGRQRDALYAAQGRTPTAREGFRKKYGWETDKQYRQEKAWAERER